MNKLIPYLLVPDVKKALLEYGEVFGAELKNHMPYTPETVPPDKNPPKNVDFEKTTMHAEVDIVGNTVYMSDSFVKTKQRSKNSIHILLELDSKELVEKIYKKAKKQGYKIIMEFQKTFWGAYYTRFSDSYGLTWQLNHQVEQV